MNVIQVLNIFFLAASGYLPFVLHASGAEYAAPIPPPPQDRSLLPAPRDGVVMVQTVHGRLNVSLGGWGGQRLIQAKTDPEKFRGYVRAVKDRGLNCVRPLFHPVVGKNAISRPVSRGDSRAGGPFGDGCGSS